MKTRKERRLITIRLISLVLAVLMTAATLFACGKTEAGNDTDSTSGTPESTSGEQTTPEEESEAPVTTNTYINTNYDKSSLKVLAIGNSFSVDGMTYLYDIAKAYGAENIILGNLYIGGCTLAAHNANAKGDKTAYEYYKNTDGKWVTVKTNASMLEGILDEDWDVITMQQASGVSGVAESYDENIENLLNYVNANKTNPDCRIAWHMTWAYQSGSSHAEFVNYENDQMKMYEAIVGAVQNKVLVHDDFKMLIPSATAIQNLRTSYIGDNATRDGYHLNELGRYTAGLTWFGVLSGAAFDELKFVPTGLKLSDEKKEIVRLSVNTALENMFSVTASAYTEDTSEKPDLSAYTELKLDYTAGGYWNSSDPARHSEVIADADNSKFFIATKQYTKSDIPVGSVIVVDSGYQYRPEAWQTAEEMPTTPRPENVTDEYTEVTEDWWADYTVRAFNIAHVGANTDLTGEADEVVSHFKIYVKPSEQGAAEPSVQPEQPAKPDLSGYTELKLEYTAGGYWNSTDPAMHSEINTTANNSMYFVATKQYTREDIPVGSIIVVDEDYQYRPEAWQTVGEVPTTPRPENVYDEYTEVTEDWWADYTVRAFNIAYLGANIDITEEADDVASHFRIYIKN